MNILDLLMGTKGGWNPDVQQEGVRPDYGLSTVSAIASPAQSQHERTLAPGQERSREELLGMLAEVILAAGAGASPVTGARGVELARNAARVRPGGEAAFNRWFAGSKAVGPGGKPMTLYHGTSAAFTKFRPQSGPNAGAIEDWPGIYLTPNRETASGIAQFEGRLRGGNANVMPVHASLKNPAELGQYKTAEEAIRAGHDGRVVRDMDGKIVEVLVFSPSQIKSATGNRGTYSPESEDIRE